MPIKRSYSLITIDGVKELISAGENFQCRYDLVGTSKDGRPVYNCIYVKDDGSESILIGSRATSAGVEPRKFQIWSGLFSHHFEYGDGSELSFNKKFLVRTNDMQGRDEVYD